MYGTIPLKLSFELIGIFNSEYWKVGVEEFVYRFHT